MAGSPGTFCRAGLSAAALVLCTVSVTLAGALSPAVAGDAVQRNASGPATPCQAVYLLGARGSGEYPQPGKPGDPSLHGLGPEVHQMAAVVQQVLSTADLTTFRTLNVGYAAEPVKVLYPTAKEIKSFREHPAAAAVYYYRHNVRKYLTSISDGISSAVSEAEYVHAHCPAALLILAGYSQGAMVMHQAELQLARDHKTGVLGAIAGTLLLGDGDRVSHTRAREFGTSRARSEGIRTWLHGNSDKDVPDPATTANICDAGDAVCDFGTDTIRHWKHAVSVHMSYTNKPVLVTAATWVARLAIMRAGQWTATRLPLPPHAAAHFDSGLTSVACASATRCIGVGSYVTTTGHTSGLLATGSGTSWTAAAAPLPAGASASADASLDSIACPSASWCVAIGSYTDSAGNTEGLTLTWSGGKWTPAELPLPPPDPDSKTVGVSGYLSISCATSSRCVAASGYTEYFTGIGEYWSRGMLLSWSGKSWTATQARVPAGGEAGSATFPYTATACSSSSCLVIGQYDDTSGSTQGFLATWSGHSWVTAKVPAPAGTLSVTPISAACPAASRCVAAGIYIDSADRPRGLAVAGARTAWKLARTVPGDLFSVACPSLNSCTISGSGNLLSESGTRWTDTVPAGLAGGALLAAVSCPSAASCAVAGQSPSDSWTGGLILTGAGSAWRSRLVTLPPGLGGSAGLSSVACPTATACVAVGGANSAQGTAALVMTGPS